MDSRRPIAPNRTSFGIRSAVAERTARRLTRIILLLTLLVLAGPAELRADVGWPCESALLPPYPSVGAPPNLRLIRSRELASISAPGNCQARIPWRSTLMVAMAGSFRYDGNADGLLARFGAISASRGIKYWSVTDGAWRVLVTDAGALDGMDVPRRRQDFTAAEMASGRDLYFEQHDNRSSDLVTYRMRVLEHDEDHAAITVENATSVWLFVIPLFDPGDLQSLYIVRRLSPGVWGFASLSGAREGVLNPGAAGSYVNRAVAIYRHIVGIPTDQDPPASP